MKPFGWVGLFTAILFGTYGGMASTRCVAQNQIDLAQFDSWIFQRHGRDESRCRSSLEREIELRFVRIEQSTPLTESQKDALRLAGQGDIKRFFDRVNDARETFLKMEQDADNRNINEAYQLASPLQQELTQGLFGDESLMQKVTRYVMTDDQATKIEEVETEQARVMLKMQSKVLLATIGRGMALTAKQQRRLQEHLHEHIQKMDKFPVERERARMNHSLIILWLAELIDEEETPHFDPDQIIVFKRLVNRANGAKPMLKLRGLLK